MTDLRDDRLARWPTCEMDAMPHYFYIAQVSAGCFIFQAMQISRSLCTPQPDRLGDLYGSQRIIYKLVVPSVVGLIISSLFSHIEYIPSPSRYPVKRGDHSSAAATCLISTKSIKLGSSLVTVQCLASCAACESKLHYRDMVNGSSDRCLQCTGL